MEINLYTELIKIKDFKGVDFLDLQPLFSNGNKFNEIIGHLSSFVPKNTQYIICPEARGFVLASALAYQCEVGLVMVRKPNKLPGEVHSIIYETEYSSDSLEISAEIDLEGSNVVFVDDVLATGGTFSAVNKLINRASGLLTSSIFLMEIEGIGGRESYFQNTTATLNSMIGYKNKTFRYLGFENYG